MTITIELSDMTKKLHILHGKKDMDETDETRNFGAHSRSGCYEEDNQNIALHSPLICSDVFSRPYQESPV